MNDKNYKGWSNYATWRVQLKIFDGLELADITQLEADDISADELGKECRAWMNSLLFDDPHHLCHGKVNQLVVDYAREFLDYVNWTEIAYHLLDEYKETYTF